MGRLISVPLMSASLPLLDKNFLFQPASLLSMESITSSQVQESLYLEPKGMPKYKIGNLTALHPIILAK